MSNTSAVFTLFDILAELEGDMDKQVINSLRGQNENVNIRLEGENS